MSVKKSKSSRSYLWRHGFSPILGVYDRTYPQFQPQQNEGWNYPLDPKQADIVQDIAFRIFSNCPDHGQTII